MSTRTVYLVDGTYNIFRAYHALPRFSTKKGLPTNAVFGFAQILRKLIVDENPTHLCVAFDTAAPTFRHEQFEQYKANRPPPPEDLIVQFPYARRVCEALGVPIIEKEGYEADDLLATIAEAAKARGFSVVIVTSDKDLFQLVDDQVRILNPGKDDMLMDAAKVEEVFGVPPNRVIEVLALSGDTSDNIPGVPGIGEKGAKEIIRRYGTIEEAFRHADEMKRKTYREGLKNHLDKAISSRQLVTIRRDVPIDIDIDALIHRPPDARAAYALFSELEFSDYQQEFAPRRAERQETYRVILGAEDLDAVLGRVREDGILSIDLETDNIDPIRAATVGVALSSRAGEGCYIPVGHSYPGAPRQLGLDEVVRRLEPLLTDENLPKVGQNIKYELILFRRHGVNITPIAFDTMIASYLIDPGRRLHNLDALALDYLDYRTIRYKEVAGSGRGEVTLDQVDVQK
ncbi:MAG: 5'-3' exonuclease H3TH domain-containing protein, partial [Acidobacteriota bacterium]